MERLSLKILCLASSTIRSASEIATFQRLEFLDVSKLISLASELDMCNNASMTEMTYKKSLDAALKELSDLMEQREEMEVALEKVDDRITGLQMTVDSLSGLLNIDPKEKYPHLFPDEISPDVGFTDAVRDVLRSAPGHIHMTPVEVRNRLIEKKFNLRKYKNALASIHTILKRLYEMGEVTSLNMDEGKRIYGWVDEKDGKKK